MIADDRYENFGGYAGGLGLGGVAPTVVGPQALDAFGGGIGGANVPANATLNPNGVGNYLVGEYFDVRPVAGNAQHVNIQILNNNTNDPSLPRCSINPLHPNFLPQAFFAGLDGELCYNPYGGIVAKVRFRDSERSVEVLDFDIVLSCGEVWAARLELRGDVPHIVSGYPIVATRTDQDPGLPPNGNGNVVTRPLLEDGVAFAIPGFAAPFVNFQDTQRGYFEVVGLSAISCEPDLVQNNTIPDANIGQGQLNAASAGGVVVFGENRWTWRSTADAFDTDFAATYAMSAVTFLVRAAAGVSFEYNATATTRFQPPFFPAFQPPTWFQANAPNFQNCSGFNLAGGLFTPSQCIDQYNLVFHKGRLHAQYDTETTTAGLTNVVITQPTKYLNCGINGGQIHVPNPFECSLIGEEVSCTIYDRIENFLTAEGGVISPFPEEEECRLPREVTIIGIRGPGDGRADIYIDPSQLPLCQDDATCAGWMEIDFTGLTKPGFVRIVNFGNVATHSLDGIFVLGYIGLPVLGLVQQEFTNGNVGGAYGAIVPTTYDDPVIMNFPES